MNFLYCNIDVLTQFDVTDDDNSALSSDGRNTLGTISVTVPVLGPVEMVDREELWYQHFTAEFIEKHWRQLANDADSHVTIADFCEVVDIESLQAQEQFGTSAELKLTYDNIGCILCNKEIPAKYMKPLLACGYDASKPLLFIAPKAKFLAGTPAGDDTKKRKTSE
jgi:hypothetical protein